MVTDQARTGVPPGAEMPVAPLPGRRSSRQAGQVILWLLLLGLAAAAVYVMLDVVMASAAGLGPHSPGPPTPPGPRTQPGPGAAGKLTRPKAVTAQPAGPRPSPVPVTEPARKSPPAGTAPAGQYRPAHRGPRRCPAPR